MDNLIFLMNKLHDTFQLVGSTSDITLPRIAVVGGQSAGKSSVLENFVGKTFLPSGSGIVTRRPLVLQLVYNTTEEYGEFTHKPGVRFDQLVGISQEISRETERICKGQNVSPEPINLRIYSPYVVNLTLVDLPGLTRVATMGQDQSVVTVIRKMVTDYISDENCLILAVTPATQDPATSDAIALAKEIDPTGDRTIGVITKLDANLNSYAEIVRTLENKSVHLKRGYVGVINRKPDELKIRVDRETLEKQEREKLDRFPPYRPVANMCGVVHLQNFLQRELMEHISRQLPKLKNNIETQLRTLELQLEGMDNVLDTMDSRVASLTRILKMFIDNVEADLGFQKEIVKEFTDVTYGSKIKEAVFVDFRTKLRSSSKVFKGNLKQIVLNIKSTSGIFSEHAFSLPAFNKCVRDCLKKNKTIVTEVSLQVKGLLLELIKKEAEETITFENLKREVILVSTQMIEEQYRKTIYHLNFVLDSQECYIDRMNPEFQRISNTKTQTIKESAEAPVNCPTDDSIVSGELIYTKKGKIGSSKKSYSGRLLKDRLELLSSTGKDKLEVRYTFLLGSASYTLLSEKFTFMLDISPHPPAELTVSSEDQLSMWTQGLENIGVHEKQANSSKPKSSGKSHDGDDHSVEDEEHEENEERPSNCPPYMWKAATEIRAAVVDYVDVVSKVLHDISSKVIFNGLPILLRYNMGTRLSANLLKVMEDKDLMKQNEFDVERIKTLKANREALKVALNIINNPQAAISDFQKSQANNSHARSSAPNTLKPTNSFSDSNPPLRQQQQQLPQDDYSSSTSSFSGGYSPNDPNAQKLGMGDAGQFAPTDRPVSPRVSQGIPNQSKPRMPPSRPLPTSGSRMPMPRGAPPSQAR